MSTKSVKLSLLAVLLLVCGGAFASAKAESSKPGPATVKLASSGGMSHVSGPVAPPITMQATCSGTCSNGTPFTCTGDTVSCTDGVGCTATVKGLQFSVSCIATQPNADW